MLNNILMFLGGLFITMFIAALLIGQSPTDEEINTGTHGIRFLISLVLAGPFFILGVVLLAVGLLRKPKSFEFDEN